MKKSVGEISNFNRKSTSVLSDNPVSLKGHIGMQFSHNVFSVEETIKRSFAMVPETSGTKGQASFNVYPIERTVARAKKMAMGKKLNLGTRPKQW